MTVVDTSVLSGALDRKRVKAGSTEARAVAEFKRLLRSKAAVGVPGIVYQEILSCIAEPAVFEKLRRRLQGLTLLLASEEDHLRAAEIASKCMLAGVTTPSVDCLIAATTIRAGARLLTTDPDFGRVASCCGLELHAY